MKKYILLAIITIGIARPVASQDAATLIPFLTEMIVGLSTVTETIKKSEEQLEKIQDIMGKIEEFQEFARNAIAIREAINQLACLAENLTESEVEVMFKKIGVPTNNLFSDFMECQYEIYYSTLELDLHQINQNIESAFSTKTKMGLPARLELINKSLKEIENIRWRTVSAKGALLEVLTKHIEMKRVEEYYALMNKI